MVANDLWELVVNGFIDVIYLATYVALTNNQKNLLKETRRKDAKALNLIEAVLIEAAFPRILTTNYAKETWEILQTRNKRTSKVRVVKLDQVLWRF